MFLYYFFIFFSWIIIVALRSICWIGWRNRRIFEKKLNVDLLFFFCLVLEVVLNLLLICLGSRFFALCYRENIGCCGLNGLGRIFLFFSDFDLLVGIYLILSCLVCSFLGILTILLGLGGCLHTNNKIICDNKLRKIIIFLFL